MTDKAAEMPERCNDYFALPHLFCGLVSGHDGPHVATAPGWRRLFRWTTREQGLCVCPYYDPVVACAACQMPMDDCDAKHDQLGNWCCFGCSHSAKLGVPHAAH